MGCYIKNIVNNEDVQTDVKLLIPDAAVRRRMSRILKMAVSTAMECCGGIDGASKMESIITATGYGCLVDSEKFLKNVINNKEELLNPTPFIQSTFNTVGGQIALLSSNHCENITYVNRSHSFEDALLDAFLQINYENKSNILVGTYDEVIESLTIILERLGIFQNGYKNGEGSVFMELTRDYSTKCKAEISSLDFPNRVLSREECMEIYKIEDANNLIYNEFSEFGLYPTVSAKILHYAVRNISKDERIVIANNYLGMNTSVIVIKGV